MAGIPSVVDGSTSRMLLWITGAVLVIITAGMVLLAAETKPIPPELTAVMTSLLGLIVGTRISPPDVTQRILDEHPNTGGENPVGG